MFAKGHLRKYAQLVGVAIDDVMADYYTMNRAVGAPPVVGAVRKQPLNISPGPWLVVVALVVVILAAVFPLARQVGRRSTGRRNRTLKTVSDVADDVEPAPAPAPNENVAAPLPQPAQDEDLANVPTNGRV